MKKPQEKSYTEVELFEHRYENAGSSRKSEKKPNACPECGNQVFFLEAGFLCPTCGYSIETIFS